MGTDYRKKIDGKKYSPQEISAMILRKLKNDAEQFTGEQVTDAVKLFLHILMMLRDRPQRMRDE